jgi:hypothetical protein
MSIQDASDASLVNTTCRCLRSMTGSQLDVYAERPVFHGCP